MSIEAMKQVLEALEEAKGVVQDEGFSTEKQDVAITSLRQSIAEAEKQEPVAWMQENQPELYVKEEKDEKRGYVIPLYTTPQQRTWVGLTDEEIELLNDCGDTDSYKFAKSIEAKLKDKNL